MSAFLADREIVERHGLRWWLKTSATESTSIDHALVHEPGWEIEAIGQLSRLVPPGARCLDIGANIGVYALELARAAGPDGRVIAIEPMLPAYTVLAKHVELNAMAGRIACLQAICGSGREPDRSIDVNYHFPWPGGASEAAHATVPVTTIDCLRRVLGRIDFIKIDTDGYQLDVFMGAQQTLHEDRPTLLFELGDGTLSGVLGLPDHTSPAYEYGAACRRLFGFLEPFDYAFYWEHEPLVQRTPSDLLTCTQPLGYDVRNYTINVFAVPRERA